MPRPGEKFEDYIKNQDAKGAAELMYRIYLDSYQARKDGTVGPQQDEGLNDVKEFIDRITAPVQGEKEKNIAPENTQFLQAFMDEVARTYYETAISLGKKRDAWEERLKSGSIPEAELVKDEPKTVKKLAHDIVLEKELDANVAIDVYLRVAEGMLDKFFEGQKAMDYYDDNSQRIREEVKKKNGLSDDQFTAYVNDMIDRNPSTSTGFKASPAEYREGEPVFEEVPEYIREIQFCTTPEELDAYEATLYETIQTYERQAQQVKSGVKVAKHLLRELDALDDGKEKTDLYKQTRQYLEEFTHLGEDYVVNDPDVRMDIAPVSSTNYPIVKLASDNLEKPADAFSDEMMAKLNALEKDGMQKNGEYLHTKKLTDISRNIFNLVSVTKGRNEEFGKLKLSTGDIEKCKKAIGYINKQRKLKGEFVADDFLNHTATNAYIQTLDEQMQTLSDCLINDGVDQKVYDDLIRGMMEQKRLSQRIMIAKHRDDRKAIQRYTKELEDHTRKLEENLESCREFEKTNRIRLNITGDNPDRQKLLERIYNNVKEKPHREDKETLSYVWGVQRNDRDEMWFGYTYQLKNLLKENGSMFSEADRERYGFNISGDLSREEEARAENYVKKITESCAHGGSLAELGQLTENHSRNVIKVSVNVGKDYDEIYHSLDGQEHQELKARYLFNRGGGRIDFGAMNEYRMEIKEKLFDFVKDDARLKQVVDIDDRTLTIGTLLQKIGISEAEMNRFSAFRKGEVHAEDKVWDICADSGQALEEQAEAKTRDGIQMYITETLFTVWESRGKEKEIASLSDTEKKYYDQCKDAVDDPENKKHQNIYAPIQDWISTSGDALAEELFKVVTVEKLNRAHAVLGREKLMGVDPSTEIGRFYHNNLQQKNTYIRDLLQKGLGTGEIIEKIVTENKSEKLNSLSPKDRPVNYDTYIALHTAGRAGDTPEKMVENLAKAMAAHALKKMDHKFNVKQIHKVAEHYKDLYDLEVMKKDPAMLREVLRGEESVRKCGKRLRDAVYGVKPQEIDRYIADMGILAEHMWSSEGRSKEYVKLCNAVKEAAGLGKKNLTPEEKAEAVRNANINIRKAVEGYTKGKEKTRKTRDGKARFDNALDVLAVAAKYAPGMNVSVNRLLLGINQARGTKKEDASYLNADTLQNRHGASRAKKANEGNLQKQKNIGTAHKKGG